MSASTELAAAGIIPDPKTGDTDSKEADNAETVDTPGVAADGWKNRKRKDIKVKPFHENIRTVEKARKENSAPHDPDKKRAYHKRRAG